MATANVLATTIKDAQRAMVIAQRTLAATAVDYMVVGAKAAMIVELKKRMQTSVVKFCYIKKNGEIREAWGTTSATLAAKHTNGNGVSREKYATTAYYDVEKGEWRSFRWESIICIF